MLSTTLRMITCNLTPSYTPRDEALFATGQEPRIIFLPSVRNTTASLSPDLGACNALTNDGHIFSLLLTCAHLHWPPHLHLKWYTARLASRPDFRQLCAPCRLPFPPDLRA